LQHSPLTGATKRRRVKLHFPAFFFTQSVENYSAEPELGSRILAFDFILSGIERSETFKLDYSTGGVVAELNGCTRRLLFLCGLALRQPLLECANRIANTSPA
jgi:hypothetical protein